jgi:ribonuclease T2
MKMIAAGMVLLLGLLGLSPALAQTKISGTLAATKACPALQSIKKSTNPGNVTTTVGTSYRIIGGNKEPATYYWIVVPGATPDYRWVAADCGTTDVTSTAPAAASASGASSSSGTPQYVLAISWEPAFCEGLPDKVECKAETASSFEATSFALHGLWPQPRSNSYCGVSAADKASDNAHNWPALPEVKLSAGTRAALDKLMPGTQSDLERHEWITHGTCYGADQETYFAAAIAAASAINASPVRDLFAAHIGQSLTLADVRGAFDKAFGAGTGDRVRVSCSPDGNRRLIEEITIGLSGTVSHFEDLGSLILAAPTTSGGCPSGIVDAIGLQ